MNARAVVEPVPITPATTCVDRLYKFKNRYLVYSIHPREHSGRLAIVFSGVDATAATCRMSYFALGATLNATVVHIMDNFGAHGCYLLSIAGDQQIRNAVISLIRELQSEFACTQQATYFLGTSKGATSAIAYSLMTNGGEVVCGEPQIMLGDFIYSANWQGLEQWRSLAYAMLGRVNTDDRNILNEVILDIVRRYGPRYSGEMQIHVGNTGYLENHIRHLISAADGIGLSQRIRVEQHSFTSHGDVVPVFLESIAARFAPVSTPS